MRWLIRIEVGGHIMTFARRGASDLLRQIGSFGSQAGKIAEDRAVADEPSVLHRLGHVIS